MEEHAKVDRSPYSTHCVSLGKPQRWIHFVMMDGFSPCIFKKLMEKMATLPKGYDYTIYYRSCVDGYDVPSRASPSCEDKGVEHMFMIVKSEISISSSARSASITQAAATTKVRLM